MKNSIFCCVLVLVALMTSCKKEDPETFPGSNTSDISLRLTDAPGNYEAVNLDIQKVEISHETEGTITLLPLRPGIYNLLDFRNGTDVLLCQGNIAPGKISQVRLILGNNNTVKIKGVTYPLSTPSAEQSGLKLNLHEDLHANMAYTFWIDFDAGRSIVATGSGQYNLKPVMRSYTALTDGRIKGNIVPLPPNTMVYAINGADTFSAIPASDGFFMFCGLPEGKYTVRLESAAVGSLDIKAVSVSFGAITNLGMLSLLP